MPQPGARADVPASPVGRSEGRLERGRRARRPEGEGRDVPANLVEG